MKSDFGKGLTYCLGLFLAHSERIYYSENDKIKELEYRTFFYTSSDHLYDLQIESAPKSVRTKLKNFREFCFQRRLDNGTRKDMQWAIQEAKDLLRLIDKANGVKTIKGGYE